MLLSSSLLRRYLFGVPAYFITQYIDSWQRKMLAVVAFLIEIAIFSLYTTGLCLCES